MTHSSRAPKVGSRTRRGAAAVLLAVTAGVATLPATALAGTWGPKYSYYDGIKRVTGWGTMTRYSNRSRSAVTACDNYNEGWRVYGYTDWTSISNGNLASSQATPESSGCTSGDWSLGWIDAGGYFVRAKACAQVGWPVPDNCTSYNAEAHRP